VPPALGVNATAGHPAVASTPAQTLNHKTAEEPASADVDHDVKTIVPAVVPAEHCAECDGLSLIGNG
jgi:hypothetical protein